MKDNWTEEKIKGVQKKMKIKSKTYWIKRITKSGKAIWIMLPGKKEYEEAQKAGEEVKIEYAQTNYTFR